MSKHAASSAALVGLFSPRAASSARDEQRIVAEILRARYDLDLLAHQARERVAAARARRPS